MGLALAHERLEQHARDCDRPHGDAQRDTAGIGQRDEAKRGVRARDEQVNAAMVDHAKDALGSRDGNGVIQRRCKIFEDERDAEDDRTGERRRMSPVHGRLHDHDDERGDAEGDAYAVRDGVRDLLAQRILGHQVTLDRASRRLDRRSDGGDRLLCGRTGGMQQALRPRCRVGARYGSRDSRDIGSRRGTVARVRHSLRSSSKNSYIARYYSKMTWYARGSAPRHPCL
ncbi:Uncharacterised protein [Collinsella intestinalis]|nr:Uncharacterised protein [Collinsella intestinalis]